MDIAEVQPCIDAAVRELRPDFRAISIVATGIANPPTHPFVNGVVDLVGGELTYAPWADAHLQDWHEAFQAFGAKPKKTPSSVNALRARVAKSGELPRINPIVDLYNATSIKFALPVGGEDLNLYSGKPRLVRASGVETFDTVRDGAEVSESPERGEVIWRDDLGVTCRRWNWRQCNRTRITTESSQLWFILEALGAMPDRAVEDAAEFLCNGLRAISPSSPICWAWVR